MKNKKKCILISCITLLLLFISIWIQISNGKIAPFDSFVYNLIPHNNTLTKIMKAITFWGSEISFLIITFLAFVLLKDRKEAIAVPVNLSLIVVINTVIKLIVQRSRPLELSLIKISGYSFPSGHSAVSLAFYGLFIFFINKDIKNNMVKFLSTVSLIMLILLIGISRVYLGVHYASDVIGGFLYSTIYLITYVEIFLKFAKKP